MSRPEAVVVGGGIAGVAAATVLAERGMEVTLVEKEGYLGGRAGAWTETLPDGTPFEMERGFHAFFRQYYNLRALLRRIDPELSFLRPLEDYPIRGPNGSFQSFEGLPRRTPANLIKLVSESPAIGLRDLLRVRKGRALEMLTFEPGRTYGRRDHMTAAEYLDSLRFPEEARRLLFDVFAHSFFNPEREMSAGELLMMFHFYFTGNPEGLVFDVCRAPFSTAIWEPFRRYLVELGVTVRLEEPVTGLARRSGGGWRIETATEALDADDVVLALTVGPLQEIVKGARGIEHDAWRASIRSLGLTNPFAVWRLWLDRPLDGHPFVGTTGIGVLDNVSLYHLFEDESREWADRTGGAVVELHAYAVDPDVGDDELRAQLLDGFHHVHPEARDAEVVHERYLRHQDCPAFAPGSHANRPTVGTPLDGLALAGDFVRLPMPSALMERACASGFMAANHLLARHGMTSEPIEAVSSRGLLAGLPL